MVPAARVGHIGMYRDEEISGPHPYFCKNAQATLSERDVLIVDPICWLLAVPPQRPSGNEEAGMQAHQAHGPGGRPEGIKFLQEKRPRSDIYAGSDDHLNEKGCRPVPGDAGDRIFGTK